jgi:hypothetical protein
MSLAKSFQLAQFMRAVSVKTIEGLSHDQLLAVPDKFNNNILWNVGHLLFYDCQFTYGRCGLEVPLPESYGAVFQHQSSPADWGESPDVDAVVDGFANIYAKIEAAATSGDFERFEPMPFNELEFSTLEEILAFQTAHEGMHLGRIVALKKFL